MKKVNSLTAIFVAGLAMASWGQENLASWSKYKDIAVNTKASGANVAEDVAEFPLLVRLNADNAADVFAQATAGGADIRFSNLAGDARPFQIEHWDAEAEEAAIWVLAENVEGNDSVAALRMYWGKVSAVPASNGAAVFDTANGFVSVVHLGDAPGASPRPNQVAGAPAAILRNFDSQQDFAEPRTYEPVPGVIGMADSLRGGADMSGDFAGDRDHIDLNPEDDYEGFSDFTTGFFFSTWINVTSSVQYERFLEMAEDASAPGSAPGRVIIFGNHTTAAQNVSIRWGAGGLAYNEPNGGVYTPGEWAYVAFSKPAGDSPFTIYADGVEIAQSRNAADAENVSRVYAVMGRSSVTAGDPYYVGKFDESVLAKTDRSAEWVKLSYETQKADAEAVVLGETQDGGTGPYADWSYGRGITLNTSASGADIAGDVENFPVLIRLGEAESDIFDQAKEDGSDIRFVKGDDTLLPHEIESWDADNNSATIWVKVDLIKGNDANQAIAMIWGNAAAEDVSDAAAVFDTAAGHRAVWHMNAATGDESDATEMGFDAEAANAPGSAAGVVGPARTFNGTDQYFVVPNSASSALNFQQTDSYTLSAWIKPEEISAEASTGHKIIDKGDNQYVLATYGPDAESRFWEITIRGNGTWNQCQADGALEGINAILASSSVGSWHHLVGTYTGGAVDDTVTQRLYYDGILVAECPIVNTSEDGRVETFDVHLGVQAEGSAPGTAFSRHWNGLLDEVRMAGTARSADWVKLEYENQKLAQRFTNIGQVTLAPSAPISVTAAQGTATGAIVVTWTAADDGGSPITGYRVEAVSDSSKSCTTTGALTCTVTGLTSGTSYSFTVTATNEIGTSPASAPSNSVLPPVGIVRGNDNNLVFRVTGSARTYTFRIPAASVETTERLTLSVFDTYGRTVWTKTVNPSRTQENEVSWNGLTSTGMKASAGMYIARVSVKNGTSLRTLTEQGITLKP